MTRSEKSPISVTNTTFTTPPVEHSSTFFPWLESDEESRFTFRKISRFPILGALGLIGSACTLVLSGITLKFFSNHEVSAFPRLFPKPAAWLSIILSINTLMIHLAISQGMAVSWWYRASRKQVTVADLHNTWAAGSLIEAVLAWKAFNYVALATIFAATLPINGILLQNAISPVTAVVSRVKPVDFNIASKIPKGWTSATLNDENTVAMIDAKWAYILPHVISNEKGWVDTWSNLTTCTDWCSATVSGIGFRATCNETTEPYSLLYDSQYFNDTIGEVLLDGNITYNAVDNIIGVLTQTKPDPTCEGNFVIHNCSLEMGTVQYHVDVVYNYTGSKEYSWSYNETSSRDPYQPINFEPFPNLDLISDRTTNTSIFAGIFDTIQEYYGATRVIVNPPSDSDHWPSIDVLGSYADQVIPSAMSSDFIDQKGTSLISGDSPFNMCNVSFSGFGNSKGLLIDDLLGRLSDVFFYSSIMIADNLWDGEPLTADVGLNWGTTQTVTDTFVARYTIQYRVFWKWWFGSMAVTISVILFILPTFWGFWMLSRRTTLSPFETARAFHAPVIQDAPAHFDTKKLLKEVGNKNLHTDLVASPVTSPQSQKSGNPFTPVASPQSQKSGNPFTPVASPLSQQSYNQFQQPR
ncbi:hypothetical protein B0O99DRAFT_683187 [Bisporella sp. PMI_857]|nr:hypothetical protein B0O99DRAFT_683187 [Bisporella sp. PMI_857]